MNDPHDDVAVVVAACNSPAPIGLKIPPTPGTSTVQTLRTAAPSRVEPFDGTRWADLATELGVGAGVAVPVIVEGRVWGTLAGGSSDVPVPVGTEDRLTAFAELAAAAIANAENKGETHRIARPRRGHRRRHPPAPATRRARQRTTTTRAHHHAGGADPQHGSGLTGLLDRIEAGNGTLVLTSPPGKGTTLHARLPIQP